MSNSKQSEFESDYVSKYFFPINSFYDGGSITKLLNRKLKREKDIYVKIQDMDKYNKELLETNKDWLNPFHINKYEIDEEDLKPFFEVFSPMPQEDIHNMDEKISFEDKYFINPKEKELIFTLYIPEFYLFTKPSKKLEEIYPVKHDFSKTKRSKERTPNRDRKHNIRVNINTRFFNTYLNDGLNKKLKEEGYDKFFSKFPHYFVSKFDNKKINKIMNSTLIQILEDENIYKFEERMNYENNLEIIQKIKNEGNNKIKCILNLTIKFLFEEYLNSKEFIEEIERLKKPNKKYKKNEFDIEKYIYLAKHFIEYSEKSILINNFV